MGQIFRAYWQPLYVYARKAGYEPEDARDRVQGFFAALLEEPFLGRADAAKGRFHSFLLKAFKLHLGRVRERAQAGKRGGGVPHLSFEIAQMENRYARELATTQTPDHLYERAWAVALLDETLQQLEREYAARGRRAWFERLRPCLGRDREAASYAEIAGLLGTTEGSIGTTVRRLRRRYLERLRALILQTVGDPGEVEDELRHLLELVRE